MTREQVRKLLGGYATGTLTAEEQQALFAAALEDQELFDELAREQSLRDLLGDPAARAHLLASIEEKPRPWWRRIYRGALIGAVAVAACVELGVIVHVGRHKPGAAPALVAEVKPEPPAPVPAPAPPIAPPGPAAKQQPAAPRKAASARAPSPAPHQPVAVTLESADKDAAARARRPARVAPRVKAVVAAADKNLAEQAIAPAAAPPPALQGAAAPLAAPAPVPIQPNPASLGALGGVPPGAAQDARSLFYAQPAFVQPQLLEPQSGAISAGQQVRQFAVRAAPALMAPNPGVKWTALRKQDDGLFSQVDPEQIRAGDVIKLRLVPNDNGSLSVMDGGRLLVAERRVVRLEPLETPEITSGPGSKELIVVLSRPAPPARHDAEPQPAQPQSPQATAAGLLRPVVTDQLSQADRSEHAVYEVKKGSNPLAPVLVRITLNFR